MELKDLVEKLNTEWASFKQENDRRLKEIEAKGLIKGDPLTEEKIDKHSKTIGELQKQIDELAKKGARAGVGGDDEKAAAKAEHRKAFEGFVRKGADAGLIELQMKAVSVGSDPAGGYAVPETIDSTIETFERDNTPMRQACKVMAVGNEAYEKLVNTGTAAGSGWVDETEARAETTTPTLAALKPYFGEVYANPGTTQKALDDLFFDVEAWLSEEVGLKFAEDENDAFTVGTGVKKPKGILAYTLSLSVDGTRTFGEVQKVHSGTNGVFVADKLLDLVHSLKRGYRNNASFMANALSVSALRKLKDGQNNYLWQGAFILGQPATLLGYPILENDDMADPATGSASLMFGDFKRAYCIVDVRGTRVLRDPFTNKPKVHFYTTKRVGGFLVNDRAVKVQVLAT